MKFETFAVPRIRGAVYDGLRKLDWVPRSVRSRARSVERAFSDLEHRQGRAPDRRRTRSASRHLRRRTHAVVRGDRQHHGRPARPGHRRRGRAGAPSTVPVRFAVGNRRGSGTEPDHADRDQETSRSREARAVAVLRRRPDALPRSARCSRSPKAGSRRSTRNRCCTCGHGCPPPASADGTLDLRSTRLLGRSTGRTVVDSSPRRPPTARFRRSSMSRSRSVAVRHFSPSCSPSRWPRFPRRRRPNRAGIPPWSAE